MFDYLTPEELSGIQLPSLENFVELYFKDKDETLTAKIEQALQNIEARKLDENLWRDLTIHYFGLPQPYYLGSKNVFQYFYQYKQEIKDFLASTSLGDEVKMAEINQCALDPEKQMLAIGFSLSLIERYKAAGHLVCVNTYQTFLNHCPKEMRGLYATQAYFHALMLQFQFRATKQIWIDLGWKTLFKENYGKPKEFVATVFANVKKYMTAAERKLAEMLAKQTYKSLG